VQLRARPNAASCVPRHATAQAAHRAQTAPQQRTKSSARCQLRTRKEPQPQPQPQQQASQQRNSACADLNMQAGKR
jgi:hypothetical protein